MINHINELKAADTMCKLTSFVRKYSTNPDFTTYFIDRTQTNVRRWSFEKALTEVWSQALQQDNPVYLGRTAVVRHKGTAIGGMECHSR